MNWGHKIFLVIVVFIIGMLSLVFVAIKQSNEMMDSNYYEQELKYQKTIDAASNFNRLGLKLQITQDASKLYIKFPVTFTHSVSEGYIEFLKPDNQKKDYKQNVLIDAEGTQTILKNKLDKGSYVLRLFWVNKNVPYYFEDKLFQVNG
jgi:hypothetical protein